MGDAAKKRGAVLGERRWRGTSDCCKVHRFASQTEERARVSCVVTGGSRHDRRQQGDGGDGGGRTLFNAPLSCRNKCQPGKKTPKIKTIFASAKSFRRFQSEVLLQDISPIIAA